MVDFGDLTQEKIDEMVLSWAAHAAIPFQKQPRNEEIERALHGSIVMAFKVALPAFPELSKVKFAYAWDEGNTISVVLRDFTDDMLVVSLEGADAGRDA
jgi:hypothetical protein